MTRRTLLAGFLGALAMYIWTALAHMLLPLGEAGLRELPNESVVLDTLRSSIGNSSGLFLFPGSGLPPRASSTDKQLAMRQYPQKLAANPSGILMYNPPGRQTLASRQFIAEFLKDLIVALLAAFLLSQARLPTYLARLAFVAVLGLLAAISTNISYWNWYGFPASYTAASIFTEFVAFLFLGFISAALVKPPPKRQ